MLANPALIWTQAGWDKVFDLADVTAMRGTYPQEHKELWGATFNLDLIAFKASSVVKRELVPALKEVKTDLEVRSHFINDLMKDNQVLSCFLFLEFRRK